MKIVREFVKKFLSCARKNERVTGVPALVTLAQAALESSWGRKAPGYNFFGIKAGTLWQGKTQIFNTKEVVKNVEIKIKDRFRAYDSPEECFADHADVLKRRFSKAFKYKDPIDFITSVQNDHEHKYATDPEYVNKIGKIIKMFNKHAGDILMDEEKNDAPLGKSPGVKKVMELDIPHLQANMINKEVSIIAQPQTHVGVDETMDCVDFGISFANAIIAANKDGELSLGDFVYLVKPVMKAPSMISGIRNVPTEIGDLEPHEAKTILDKVKTELNVDGEKANRIVNKAIVVAYAVYELIEEITD